MQTNDNRNVRRIIAAHTAKPETPQTRLSDYAPGIFMQLQSRNSVKKAIKKGLLLFNGEAASTGDWVTGGCSIELLEEVEGTRPVYEHRIEQLYEDEEIAIVLKPAGIAVNGNRFKSVENMLPASLTKSTRADALRRPLPVHRIDAQTSGLLLVAKTASAMRELGRQFENREITKHYRAVVIGKLEGSATIDIPIENRPARSHYQSLRVSASKKYGWLSLVDLQPETGRTHQLRIHMSRSAHPIVGDSLYSGNFPLMRDKGLFLCALSLSFTHPASGEAMHFETAQPHKFDYYMNREEQRAGLL